MMNIANKFDEMEIKQNSMDQQPELYYEKDLGVLII